MAAAGPIFMVSGCRPGMGTDTNFPAVQTSLRRPLASDQAMGPPLEPRLFVLELGISVGLFARFFLDPFKTLCASEGKDYYRRLTFVAGDRSERMLADSCRHWVFARHADGPQALPDRRPRHSRRESVPGGVLTYLLDCLPAADLKSKDGQVSQLCVRTCPARPAPILISPHRFSPWRSVLDILPPMRTAPPPERNILNAGN
jgi:hypothetical protein